MLRRMIKAILLLVPIVVLGIIGITLLYEATSSLWTIFVGCHLLGFFSMVVIRWGSLEPTYIRPTFSHTIAVSGVTLIMTALAVVIGTLEARVLIRSLSAPTWFYIALPVIWGVPMLFYMLVRTGIFG